MYNFKSFQVTQYRGSAKCTMLSPFRENSNVVVLNAQFQVLSRQMTNVVVLNVQFQVLSGKIIKW
jgi:hypothetical protein